MIKRMFDDPREIVSIIVEGARYQVGWRDCTKIEYTEEGGEMGTVPWFAVWFTGDDIWPSKRINGKFVVEVNYKER